LVSIPRRGEAHPWLGLETPPLRAYQDVADVLGDPLVVIDSEQRIVIFSTAAVELFGYPAEEAIGRHLNLLIPEPFHSSHRNYVADFASYGAGYHRSGTVRALVQGRRSDGSEFPAEITLSTLEIDGELLSAAALRDVTARVEIERALAASERRFRAVFEDSPVAMVLVTLDGDFMSGNKAFLDQMGYSSAEMSGIPMEEIIHPDDRQILPEKLAPVLAGGQSTARMELRVMRRDGIPMMVDLFLAPVADDGGRPTYMIGQAIDISERVAARAQLQQLVQSKDELIASISHELRTPLTSLVGFAQLLDEGANDLSPTERAEMISLILSESVDLTNIVEDLLVAARAETGAMSVAEVPVDLHAQAAQVLETWNRPDADRIELAGSAARSAADPARVRQILRNLISNAFRYGKGGISIELRDDPGWAVVVVSNEGPPIPEPDRERIFEPYERAHRLAGLTASMGLGLSISRHLARLMQGDVGYDYVGGWNIFTLKLPRLEPSPD
jgi:PAS domain S-box-containing protein